ncbi:MAG: hypothetical protein QOG32_1735, partial [Chloroflexota bacterium]|nr:hypothetical protein [Chloroflexota bacterium]
MAATFYEIPRSGTPLTNATQRGEATGRRPTMELGLAAVSVA